jgi:hypothetical protein
MSKTTSRLYSCYRISGKSKIVLVLNQEHNEGAWTIEVIDPNILNLSPRQKGSALPPSRFTLREIFLQVSITYEACWPLQTTDKFLPSARKCGRIIELTRLEGIH